MKNNYKRKQLSETVMEKLVSTEAVELDKDNLTVSYPRTEFAAVIFHNIPETYPDDAHIECCYTITPDLVPTSRDWIGLYKVGWMTTRDYYYYEWAKFPENYEIGKETEGNVLFPASTPFKFKKPSADDFVEIEDEESEMLFIRSKSAVLEETISRLEDDKFMLLQKQEEFEVEREELMTKLKELNKQLEILESDKIKLHEQVQSGEEYITQLNREARDMAVLREELQTRNDASNQLKTKSEQRVKELEEEIKELQSLKEQMEIYKNHFQCSEKSAQDYCQQMEEMQIKLAKQESSVDHYRRELEHIKIKLAEERAKVEQHVKASQEDQENLARLNEKLKNTEDKLSAAENTKILMQEEIKTYEELKEQLSNDLEVAKSKVYTLTQQMTTVEENFSTKTEVMNNEITLTQEELYKTRQREIEKNHLVQYQVQAVLDFGRDLSRSSSVSDTTVVRLQQELENVSQCLDKRQDKKDRYKKLYLEEHEKLESLQKQLGEEISQKLEAMERLRKINEEKSSYEIRIRSLEKCVDDKEKIIEELNRKLRDNARIHDGPASAEENRPTPITVQPIPVVPCMYSSAYVPSQYHQQPIVYPPHTPLTRLNYPTAQHVPLTPLRYPDHGKNVETDGEADNITGGLSAPLQPLPPPLIPERLQPHMSKDNLHGDFGDHGASEFFGNPQEVHGEKLEAAATIPTAPPAHLYDTKEEKYEDAIGEAMKVCPVCNNSFSSDIDDGNFEAHILSHVGRICPICHQLVEDVSDNDFTDHVNEHLDKKSHQEDDRVV
ncbi:hypothetical protein KUTeg_014892 [Tegillarca granosa]|uniref:Uncharacterized protein n=1 Tax=Tegillarca granosa TaxID=220873 RepID=A0ABQ9EU23_TEGGR|nr:hypothetical protein KUTeg_014892 [Tegillarca granosa]